MIGEIRTTSSPVNSQQPQQTERQKQIAVAVQSHKFEIGQIVDATVSNVKGKEVTYELTGQIKLTVKEPKKFAELSAKQQVKVEITKLRENGAPKKVKCVN